MLDVFLDACKVTEPHDTSLLRLHQLALAGPAQVAQRYVAPAMFYRRCRGHRGLSFTARGGLEFVEEEMSA